MFKFKCTVIVLILNFVFINAITILNLKHPTTKYGFVYPNRAEPNKNITYVLEGVDVLINLAKVPENYKECKLTTPDLEFTHTLTPGASGNDKVAFWSPNSNPKECGARIKNVQVKDSGRWRLQAVNTEGDYKIQSFINLQVIKNFDRENGNFEIRKDKDNELNITYLANYCQISNPHLSGNYSVYDHCSIDLENINRLYGGKWKVSVGVYGKIDEIRLEPNITVLEETFDVGTNKTDSKINLFCNLKNVLNTTETAFCRFVKNGEDIGLRLNEGLSNGKYSYYGRSLKDGDCGVTIENPETTDYVTWKCTIGFYRNKGDKKLEKYEVKESVISLSKNKRRYRRSLNAATRIDEDADFIDDVLGGINNPLTISYKADFRIKYCIVKHPNGTLFSINGAFHNDDWFTNGELEVGICKMTLNKASDNEIGVWQLQLGHYDITEMNEVKKVRVRIGQTAIVAIEQNIQTSLDSELTIKCKSVAEPKALEYCRFSLPNGEGFQINENIRKSKPIDHLYWYKQVKNESINNGYCQVTIIKVNPSHIGRWTCAGQIMGSNKPEDFDYINVSQGGLTVASISGIVVGVALVIIIVGGVIIHIRRKRRQQPQRRQTYLSSASETSAEVLHFQRSEPDPLVSMEEERQPAAQLEEIEMIDVSHTESIELRRGTAVSQPELRRETSTSQPESRRQTTRSEPEEIITSI